MSKWDGSLATIQTLAGKVSAPEIARRIGTTTPNLHKICHRNKISLPRPEAYEKRTPDIATCLRAGYTVIDRPGGQPQ